jgi:hypothetical protein
MNVYYDARFEADGVRAHPWDYAERSEEERYYDFKEHPELIPEVLEDYRPWAQSPAVQSFYELLRWINGEDSALETSDCAFMGPRPNDDPKWRKKLFCSGRLMILFRDLPLNTVYQYMQQLNEAVHFYLERLEPEFRWGSVGTTLMHIYYTDLNRPGRQLMLSFWAWGDTEEETFANLDTLIRTVSECIRKVSRDVKEAQASSPAA